MHSRKSKKLSDRMYKKWVERFRMSFHAGVGIVCALLYLFLANSKTLIPPEAALWLYGINFIIALLQWNHHRLYRFANSSRYMKGIPEKKLQVINGMYLLIFFLIIGAITVLLMQLPLMKIGTFMAILIRDVLRFVFSGFAKTTIDTTGGQDTEMHMEMHDYVAALKGDAPVNTMFGRMFERLMVGFGLVFTCFLVIYTLVKIYRSIWEKVRFQFDDEVLRIEKEEKNTRIMMKSSVLAATFHKDTGAQFRRAYRKMIQKHLKKGSRVNPAWTPGEIETFAGLAEEEEYQKIHEMYECIRYGRKESFDKQEAERLRHNMR